MDRTHQTLFKWPGSPAAVTGLLIGAAALVAALGGAPRMAEAVNASCDSPYSPAIVPAEYQDSRGRPNAISNPYLPLKPGTTLTYEGTKESQTERDVVQVTRLQKSIMGVSVTSTQGSWQAGANGALPGIIMEARPRSGDSYRQEYAPGVAVDMAAVLSLQNHVIVPYGSFDNVVETKEYSCLESGLEHKDYARGVGMVSEVATSSGKEEIKLVSVETH